MQGSKHTPGPWQIVEMTKAYDVRDSWSRNPDACYDIAVVHAHDEQQREQAAANAHLIAAAPDLLAHLKNVVACFDTARLLMADKGTRDMAGEIVADARAAIAKAEGR